MYYTNDDTDYTLIEASVEVLEGIKSYRPREGTTDRYMTAEEAIEDYKRVLANEQSNYFL